MESLFKEGKKIVHSYTKCAQPFEVANEVAGYAHAESVGIQVANLLHHSKGHLTVERVDGISSFRYLELLKLHGKEFFPRMREVLMFLLQEVVRFQSKPITPVLASSPYAAEEKTAKVAEVMQLTGHRLVDALTARIPKIAELFVQFATVPFRDATPKNSILSGVNRDNALSLEVNDVVAAIRHIDFRSVAELTPRSDDYISVLWHYMIPDQMRRELLAQFGVDHSTLEFIVAKFVRVARFWGRRQFYFHRHPEMYRRRYDIEDLSFYDEQFDLAVEEILEVTP